LSPVHDFFSLTGRSITRMGAAYITAAGDELRIDHERLTAGVAMRTRRYRDA
jgi:hypothetical protein